MCCRKKNLTTFRSRQEVLTSMVIFDFGIALISSSFFAVMNLQSSINIERGLGVSSLALFSTSMLISGVIISPILAKSISARTSFILCDVLQLCLALANIYPNFFTMLPGSVLSGVGRGLFWAQSSVFSVYYAKMLANTGTEKFTSCYSKTNGCFFAVFASGQIFGNLIPFFVLGINNPNVENKLSMNHSSNSSDSYEFSTPTYSIKDICGANDCQDPSVIQDASSNFQRPKKNVLNLLWGILIGIHVIGTIVHILFAPLFADVDIDNDVKCHQCQQHGAVNKTYIQDGPEIDGHVNENMNMRKVSHEDNNKRTFENNVDVGLESSNLGEKSNEAVQQSSNKIAISIQQFKYTIRCFFKPSQLLLAGIEFHEGSSLSFVSTEVTRAFVSCVYGVKQVGLSMAFYGASVMIFAYTIGKVSAKYGRKVCIGFGTIVNLAIYFVFLYWIPDENTSVGVIYFLLFLYGICDAVFPTITTETAIIHHTANTQAAYSCWLTWTSLGFIVQFSWSTSVCVRQKLYVMIAVLIFGVVAYGIAEYKHTQKTPPKQKKTTVVNAVT